MELNKDMLDSNWAWFPSEGQDLDVVISSRIRLARNLANFPFSSKATPEQKENTEAYILGNFAKAKLFQDYTHLNLASLDQNEIALLVEQHLISRDHAQGQGSRSVLIKQDQTISVMINEEDHIRMQILGPGLQLSNLYNTINALDDDIDKHVPYAFHPKFGYLTACPTNAGTGLRVSVMFHLPSLTITKQMDKIYQNLIKKRLSLRGFYGEGTSALGDFYQLSNQISMGKTEAQLIQMLEAVVPQIMDYERKVRENLISHNAKSTNELVQKAWATLRSGESISSEKSMCFLSHIRLGIYLDIIKSDMLPLIHRLFVLVQPAHLQKIYKGAFPPEERDQLRGKLIKKLLQ